MKTSLGAFDLTTVLTSCGRWNLLTRTLDSFLAHHEPGRFILVEDSADADFAERVRERYPFAQVLLNDPRLGQHRAIDRAYSTVRTSHVLHLEDDWEFVGPLDPQAGIGLLGARDDVAAVCFRQLQTLKLTHRLRARRFEHGGHSYADMRGAHREWYGYTFNPSIVRLETWREYGPFAEHANERSLSRSFRAAGLHVVLALPGICGHIGSGRSVHDPARAGEHRRLSTGWRARLGFGKSG